MKKTFFCFVMALFILNLYGISFAHFGMIIPSDSMVMQDENKVVKLTLSFSHPFEGEGMELAKPAQFFVITKGKKESLLSALKEKEVMQHKGWTTNYKITRPGVYAFVMEPKPYWEPVEDCYILHYTKTCVTSFGDDDGWDEELGLKTEIVPLTKPFGLYAGNVFQGIVKLNGNPVPFAEVEVEYYNEDGKSKAPTDYMVTQTIKADINGIFTYGVPKSGWWGFAALNTSDKKIKYKGEDKDVEIGAVIWIRFHPFEVK